MGLEKHKITKEELMSLALERERYVRLAMIYVRNRSDAEDIFHDLMLRLYMEQEKFYVSDLKSYFSSSVKHSCLRFLCRNSKSEHMGDDLSALEAYFISRLQYGGFESTSFEADFPDLFKKCAERLPKLTLEVFAARRLEKMSYKEIGEAFGISSNRINYEIKRALAVFREVFKDYHYLLIFFFYGL